MAAVKKKGDKPGCANCGDTEAPVKHCSRCKLVSYCGKECQAANWKSHKKNCVAVDDGKRKPTQMPERTNLPDEMCCICLDAVTAEDWKLPCSHVFHETCIKEMIKNNKDGKLSSCPNCRATLPPIKELEKSENGNNSGGGGGGGNAKFVNKESQYFQAMRNMYCMKDSGGYSSLPKGTLKVCSSCGQQNASRPCQKCGLTIYCNKRCETKHRKTGGHKEECDAYTDANGFVGGDARAAALDNADKAKANACRGLDGTSSSSSTQNRRQSELAYMQGVQCENRQQYQQAVVYFKKALALNEKLFAARSSLATLLRREFGDVQGCISLSLLNIKLFKQLRQPGKPHLDTKDDLPEDLTYEYFLADLLTNAGNALDHMGKIARSSFRDREAQQYFQEACALYQEAIETEPKNTLCLINYGNCLVRNRKPVEGMQIRKKAVEANPDLFLCNYNYAESLKHVSSDYAGAAHYYDLSSKCKDGGNRDPDTFLNCAECCLIHAIMLKRSIASGSGQEKEQQKYVTMARSSLAKGQRLDPHHDAIPRINSMLRQF